MRFMTITLLVFFVAACSSGLNRGTINPDAALTHLKSNLEFLASDELEGREATKHGAFVAAQFLASRLQQYGVKPFGDYGTYFQNFELESEQLDPSSRMILIAEEEMDLALGINYIAYRAGKKLENSEIVFVGHGITDSSYNWDDYAGLDVTGKTVLCLYGIPAKEGDPDFMKKDRRRLGRSTVKARMAAAKGADGVIVLLSSWWMNRWNTFKSYALEESIGKPSEEETEINAAWLDSTTVKGLVGMTDSTYSAVLKALNKGQLEKGSVIAARAMFDLKVNKKMVKARNVVGILKGTDPTVKDEYVTIGAHYDHEGIKGDQVYNGADDNGSGTVAILESARELSFEKANRRSIIYTFFTAEEKGLLGAEFFANNVEYIKDVVVNINMDMVGREHEDSIYVVGSGALSSEFFDIVEEANKETVNFIFDYELDDPQHPTQIYRRSDHWEFAQKDIPVVFLTDWHKTDYHKPTDTADKINYKKVYKVARLTSAIALKVANMQHRLKVDYAEIYGAQKNKTVN